MAAETPETTRSALTTKSDLDPIRLLVERAQAGECDAVAELLRLHQDSMEAVIRDKFRLDQDGHECGWEDCLEAVKVKILQSKLRNLKEYHGPTPLREWFKTVAFNTARDFLRAKRTSLSQLPADPEGQLMEQPDRDPRSAGSVVGYNEVIQLVREELGRERIPAKYREVLRLRYGEANLDVPAIAEQLGINRTSAYQRLARAEEWIRQNLWIVSKIRKAGEAIGKKLKNHGHGE